MSFRTSTSQGFLSFPGAASGYLTFTRQIVNHYSNDPHRLRNDIATDSNMPLQQLDFFDITTVTGAIVLDHNCSIAVGDTDEQISEVEALEGFQKELHLVVGGRHFVIPRRLVEEYPETRLAVTFSDEGLKPSAGSSFPTSTPRNTGGLQDHVNIVRRLYYFQRSPRLFPYVVNFYHTGTVHIPNSICPKSLMREMVYWGIPLTSETLCHCCGAFDMFQFTFQESQDSTTEDWTNHHCCNWRQRLWTAVDSTHTYGGKAFMIVSVAFLMISLALMTVDSVQSLAFSECCQCLTFYSGNFSECNSFYTTRDVDCQSTVASSMCAITTITTLFFVVEFALRLISCPSFVKFARDAKNWVDLVAFLPFFLEIAASELRLYVSNKNLAARIAKVVRPLRFLRVLRLFKMFRHSSQMRKFAKCLLRAKHAFVTLLVILSFTTVIASSGIYYMESADSRSPYHSIPTAAWWGIATMFAYGDNPPISLTGKITASIAAIAAMVMLSIPVGLILDAFSASFGDGND